MIGTGLDVWEVIATVHDNDNAARVRRSRLAHTRRTVVTTVVHRHLHVAHGGSVPEVCRFYGIVVAMFWDEHPPPHFHVRYGGAWAKIEIGTDALIAGRLPRRAHGLVREWDRERRDDLHANWVRTENREAPMPIEPLR